MQKFVTDRQLAERYAVSRASIWRWVSTGQLPQPIALASGTTRWNLEDVLKHEQRLERRRTPSAA
jgi:predicted DNA-binding transcriptional regulator AlpA